IPDAPLRTERALMASADAAARPRLLRPQPARSLLRDADRARLARAVLRDRHVPQPVPPLVVSLQEHVAVRRVGSVVLDRRRAVRTHPPRRLPRDSGPVAPEADRSCLARAALRDSPEAVRAAQPSRRSARAGAGNLLRPRADRSRLREFSAPVSGAFTRV